MGNPLVDIAMALVAFGLLVAMVGRISGNSLYDRIGGDSTMPDGDAADAFGGAAQAQAEREAEIKQMLQARSERLVRMGQPPLDLDAETARLLEGERPPGDVHRHDPQLVDEMRQLANARNQRRMKRGEPPLDVQAEVAKALARLEE